MVDTRISKNQCHTGMACIMALRSTCLDKHVGCVITNYKNEVIATGYNGAPRGYEHCTDLGFCKKEQSGSPNDCPSTHAEINALVQCRVPEQIHTVYVTLSPCIACVRAIMNTSCKQIVFLHEHRHKEAGELWKGGWRKYGLI